MTAAIAVGAEASIVPATWLGRGIVEKRRIPKTYRHPVLDARLRDERTRDEARLLMAARVAGVPVPIVYDIDRAAGIIHMQRVTGRRLKDVLADDEDAPASARMARLGTLTAKLHDAGITHGDLTTSNALVPDEGDPDSLIVIDLGLGQWTQEDEQRAVDLHLIEEALEATDDRAAALFEAFLAAYTGARDASGAVRRLEAVRERGRYRGAA